ncbi:arylsulfotransferase family protein [Aspergillus ruber CBS 135680]|uniref:ASST-domain-containing protein n=1 Tax=Aspergillus ruber (strain CBS 135680) TaxID=1388766 RepID=A0A017S7A8_ASPRC|nr:uncharacterized protein EURHEDRAFT_505258 [Aspergillus ruber CBS 135680]EYE92847.1 hypothetical protein EURHEDRAFT_505258 [Aspergillus ruber CBS 135680]
MPTWLPSFKAILTLTLATFTSADFGPRNQSTEHNTGLLGTFPTETYRSSPLIGPSLNYIQDSLLCHDELYTLLALRGSDVRTPGPMIIDSDGHLVWTNIGYGNTHAVGVYEFKGHRYLGFGVEDNGLKGFGDGVYYLLDSSYEKAYTIKGANGFPVGLREFHITRDETAVIATYKIKTADLRFVGGPQDGRIYDSIVQEINIETGKLLFQWRASEHVDITQVPRTLDTEAGTYVDHQGQQAWDFFRINSIDKDSKGNFLVSSSSTNTLSYIDGRTKKILWNLGGQNNSFNDLSGGIATQFSGQHHARFHNDNTITLFDNNANTVNGPSQGLYLTLDYDQMTVSLLHTYAPPTDLNSSSGGSLQLLPTGNILQSYGQIPAWTEFSINGDILCHVHFGAAVSFNSSKVFSDRIAKGPWTGLPKTSPDIALYGYEAAVSWNGATTVTTYILEGTNDLELDMKQAIYTRDHPPPTDLNDKNKPPEFTFLSATPKSGFESILPIPNTFPAGSYLRIRALNKYGHVVGITKLTHWDPDAGQPIVGIGGPAIPGPDLRPLGYFLGGFSIAVVLAMGVWLMRRRIAARRVYGHGDSERGGYGYGGGWDDGDEELSDRELIDAVEFSLLGGKALRARGVRGLEDSDESDEERKI